MRTTALIVVALLTAGCGSSAGPTGPAPAPSSTTPPGPSPYIDGFNPAPVAAGYTRFITPPLHDIAPQSDILFCQWLTGAATDDQDVLDVTGAQAKFGHHAILYSTSSIQPVGTTRVCTGEDMTAGRFLGGIGGEGGTDLNLLPPGVAFRIPKGTAIMANVHVLNTGSQTISNQAVLDVKFAAPSPERQLAGLFASTTLSFKIPPHASGYPVDVSCKSQTDIPLYIVSNHMHAYGVSAFTEIVPPSGPSVSLVTDDAWLPEYAYNPHFVHFSVEQPTMIHSGDTVHTHCVWNGDPTKTIQFPDEMCAVFGLFVTPTGNQHLCANGSWLN